MQLCLFNQQLFHSNLHVFSINLAKITRHSDVIAFLPHEYENRFVLM